MQQHGRDAFRGGVQVPLVCASDVRAVPDVFTRERMLRPPTAQFYNKMLEKKNQLCYDESMKPLTLLIKPAAGLCNLRCGYCFYRAASETRENRRMTAETADALIRQIAAPAHAAKTGLAV